MNLETLARTAGDVADPTPDTLSAGRHRLDAAIDAAGVRVTAVRRSTHRRRRSVGILATAAAAAGAFAATSFLTAPAASAEGVLLAAADAAGEQVDITDGAAYWHVLAEVDYPDIEPGARAIWVGRTADGVLRDETQVTDPADVRTESLDHAAMYVVGGTELSWADLDALPTDPVALGELLRGMVAGHESGEDNELWESVTGLLRESPASPELRRALWQVAATVPGVELVGSTTDSLGRAGTAIERDMTGDGWFRVVYVLDPNDGTLLETRDLREDGTVAYRWTLVEQGPAATAPEPQPPLCGPGSVPERSC